MDSLPSRYINQKPPDGVRPPSPSPPTQNGAWVLETIRCAFDAPPSTAGPAHAGRRPSHAAGKRLDTHSPAAKGSRVHCTNDRRARPTANDLHRLGKGAYVRRLDELVQKSGHYAANRDAAHVSPKGIYRASRSRIHQAIAWNRPQTQSIAPNQCQGARFAISPWRRTPPSR